jgi:hypothetical protein
MDVRNLTVFQCPDAIKATSISTQMMHMIKSTRHFAHNDQ